LGNNANVSFVKSKVATLVNGQDILTGDNLLREGESPNAILI
jgi:hypothetical protein